MFRHQSDIEIGLLRMFNDSAWIPGNNSDKALAILLPWYDNTAFAPLKMSIYVLIVTKIIVYPRSHDATLRLLVPTFSHPRIKSMFFGILNEKQLSGLCFSPQNCKKSYKCKIIEKSSGKYFGDFWT